MISNLDNSILKELDKQNFKADIISFVMSKLDNDDKKNEFLSFMIDNRNGGTDIMRKSISISIRVSEDELEKFKEAARLEAYASYSEVVRRTALIEATRIIKENNEGENTHEYN